MPKALQFLFLLTLLLSCKEKCDSSCEMLKEFELSPTRIDFSYIRYPKPFHINASMTRTETGVLVKLKDGESIEFSMEEWLDYVKALYKYGIKRPIKGNFYDTREVWKIKIYSLNEAEPVYYGVYNYRADRPNKVKNVIDDIEKKIKDSLSLACDSSCEMRKAKFKNSTIGIKLEHAGAAQGGSWYVDKTTTGASARYLSPTLRKEKTLSMEEWQDLINVLSECFINWENEKGSGTLWAIYILSSNKNKKIDTLRYDMLRNKPSVNNWKTVMGVIQAAVK
jgi:hypothetical protein